MGVRVPWTDEQAIECLVNPDFPDVVEAESLREDSNHPPEIEQDYVYGDNVEHCFCGEVEALLSPPEAVDSNSLSCNSNDEEVG